MYHIKGILAFSFQKFLCIYIALLEFTLHTYIQISMNYIPLAAPGVTLLDDIKAMLVLTMLPVGVVDKVVVGMSIVIHYGCCKYYVNIHYKYIRIYITMLALRLKTLDLCDNYR